jgi:hypothetical protein
MAKTIYLNLDDDIAKITSKLKREKATEVVLVFPKKSFLFADSINLRLLKKQIDLLGKEASILTMDERGQDYAKEAGFALKFLPRISKTGGSSDIRMTRTAASRRAAPAPAVVPVPTPTVRKVAPKKTAAPVRRAATAAPIRRAPRPVARSTEPVRIQDNLFTPLEPSETTFRMPPRRSYKKFLISFIAAALIIVLALVLVVLPSATVAVYAKSQTIARDIDIIVDAKATAPDSNALVVPAVPVNKTETERSTFQVNGKKEVGAQAQGRVAIYNLTGSPLNLKASTTVLTVGSKNYVFTADQTAIKALPNANSDQDATVADIIAQAGGDSFNLPSGTRLEITNQSFGSQPQRLYAKTVTQVIGGSSRFVSIITADDIKSGQQGLTDQLLLKIREELAVNRHKLIDGAYTITQNGFITDKSEGTEAQTFAAEAQVVIAGLAFDEQATKEMLRQRLQMSMAANRALQNISADTITYKVKNIDIPNGVMQLSVHYESKALPNIDATALRNQVTGKGEDAAKELILNNPDVERVEITVSPAWQSTLPRFSGKIDLEVIE